jgi:hypothetical protein
VASAQETRIRTLVLFLLGFLTFVTVSVFIYPGPGEVNEGREHFHEAPNPPQTPIGRARMFFPLGVAK